MGNRVTDAGPGGTAPLIAGLQAELAEVESARAHLNHLVRQAPVAIVITHGPDHLVELANDGAAELLGRSGLEGKTVREAVPEAVGQGFLDLLDRVYAGEPYRGREVPVTLHRAPGGPPEEGYYDLLYRPLRDEHGRPEGVFALGVEVTEQVRARRRAEALAAAAAAAERALRESHAMLGSLLDTAPVGIGFWDRQLRYVQVNEALAEIHGRPASEHIGRDLREVLGDFGAELEGVFRTILATGEPVLEIDVTGETPARPGQRRTWTASYYPVPGPTPGDAPIGVGAIVMEVTERVRRRERERLLADAGLALETSLGVEARVSRVCRLMVPRFADACVVHLTDGDGRLTPFAVEHVDPDLLERMREVLERHPGRADGGGAHEVLATGRPALRPEVHDARLRQVAEDGEHLEALRQLHVRSDICVPLRARGRTLGTLTLARLHGDAAPFATDDLAVAEELGRRLGLALDNARLYESQRHIAATLQASLLPPRLPAVPHLDVATRYRAAGEGVDVGGDFYDLVACDGGWMLVLGDVCGKGAEAAAMTALCRYTVRATARRDARPSRVLHALNDEILREHDDQRFCTAVCVRIAERRDPRGGAVPLLISRAGHPRPYVLRRDGRVESVDAAGGLVGVRPAPSFEERPYALGAGDSLVLYTDGVTEAHGGPGGRALFGPERLEEVLRGCAGLRADEVAEAIEATVAAYGAGAARDDLAIVVAQARPSRLTGARRRAAADRRTGPTAGRISPPPARGSGAPP